MDSASGKLRLNINDAVAGVRAGPDTKMSDESEQKFLNSYNRLVKRGAKLNLRPE